MNEKICDNCKYWRDYKKGIEARVSGAYNGTWPGGIIKLRPCSWQAHPSVNVIWRPVYTDENYSCCEFEKHKL